MMSMGPPVPRPAVARKAAREPAVLGRGNANLWEDMREVLLDWNPDPRAFETMRRWIRDEIEQELLARLARGHGAGLVRWACRLNPSMIWKLPHSRCPPPARFHRRIAAILLPQKLSLLEDDLVVLAFHDGLHREPDQDNLPPA